MTAVSLYLRYLEREWPSHNALCVTAVVTPGSSLLCDLLLNINMCFVPRPITTVTTLLLRLLLLLLGPRDSTTGWNVSDLSSHPICRSVLFDERSHEICPRTCRYISRLRPASTLTVPVVTAAAAVALCSWRHCCCSNEEQQNQNNTLRARQLW